MLHLKNIKISNEVAEADYYPETETEASHIAVDLETEEIKTLQEGRGSWEMYSSHAASALIRMAKEKDTRTEQVVMWY